MNCTGRPPGWASARWLAVAIVMTVAILDITTYTSTARNGPRDPTIGTADQIHTNAKTLTTAKTNAIINQPPTGAAARAAETIEEGNHRPTAGDEPGWRRASANPPNEMTVSKTRPPTPEHPEPRSYRRRNTSSATMDSVPIAEKRAGPSHGTGRSRPGRL